MSDATRVLHPTLGAPDEWAAAAPLAAARLTDRQRLAVLLEGAALLSLLERAAWCLPRGWAEARVAAGGRLALPAREAAPGRSPRPAQEQLRELLLRLYGAAGAAAGDPGAAAWSCEAGEGGAAPGSGLLAGRGEARRAARELLAEWWQPLVPLPADEAVAQILTAAPFLWMSSFAAARQSLAGELLGPAGDRLWVAGPSASRSRLLAAGAGKAELAARLAGADARDWWEGAAPPPVAEAPSRAAAARQAAGTPAAWRARIAAARLNAPVSETARLELAAAFAGLGRFNAALGTLAACRAPAARLLRARCQQQLGRLGAARSTLRRLAELPLAPDMAIEAAEMAVRIFANSGEPTHVPLWVRRAQAAARPASRSERARSFLVAAVAAWDRQDLAGMDAPLEAARAALFDGGGVPAAGAEPGSGPLVQALWRWHHARGLRAMTGSDGAAVVEHLGLALRCGRRHLANDEAAALWNDLGIGRVQTGDLPRAERAFLHAQRLLGGCDGPRRTTLALHNLAEVRLRRGRTAGLREILARSTAENRSGGNLRGLTQDTELWARLELVLGRPAEAAALCRAAVARLERRRSRWRRGVLAVLNARALGWLARPSEAAAELALAGGEAVAELEPEERPALWAHAGDRPAALRAAAALGPPLRALWQAALAGEPVPVDTWEALAGLEPYRAARLVFDLERAAAGALLAPAAWRRPAIATLRRVGAAGMAEWLESREAGPWQALAAYAARPAGDLRAIAALLRRSGDPDARLAWIPAGEVRETPAGGDPSPAPALLAADLPAGRLELHGRQLDPALTACFALAVRDLADGGGGPRPVAGNEPPLRGSDDPDALDAGQDRKAGEEIRPRGPASSLVGSSPSLRAAVARLARVATADIPVLIRGESGTGKELAAREIHRASARAHGPFVAVNCAALAESLQLSDLFGHVRGAFTGADRDRVGVFEAARGGTVLLDEIGDLPLGAQGLLLRVLQESEVRRLGESLPRRVDVRVLAATHRDLERAVAGGTFREDLFYRLKVGAVDLPPLRERGDDVLQLADLFLSRHRPPPPPRLAAATRDRLRAHSWPGNVRELENVLRLAAALAGGGIIQPEHLELPRAAESAPPADAAAASHRSGESGAVPPAAAGSYHRQVESLRRQLVVEAIAAAAGNHAEAARRLGISRQALSYLVRQLGLR
ncbi:MAG TPA: sigma 54-interacting transcriptional regulator [Thermoanaerobaculia bacterium]|nr:sigma 54-interacting transcriptional regulator [Thermoanaerobaculia bacterium]